MGLHMNQRYLNLSLMLLVGFVCFVISCTRTVKEKKVDLGPQFSVDDINNALNSVKGDRTPLEIHVGDQALYEINQRIESNEVTVLKDILTQVKDMQEDEYLITYHLEETTQTYTQNKTDVLKTESEISIAKIKLPQLPPASVNHTESFSSKSLLQAKTKETQNPVTFHNLVLTTGTRQVPEGVSNDPHCRNLNPCELKINELKFDLVEWVTPQQGKMTQYRYIYAANTPYLAHLVLLCIKQLVDNEKRNYLVSQCQVLKDFSFGSSSN